MANNPQVNDALPFAALALFVTFIVVVFA